MKYPCENCKLRAAYDKLILSYLFGTPNSEYCASLVEGRSAVLNNYILSQIPFLLNDYLSAYVVFIGFMTML